MLRHVIFSELSKICFGGLVHIVRLAHNDVLQKILQQVLEFRVCDHVRMLRLFQLLLQAGQQASNSTQMLLSKAVARAAVASEAATAQSNAKDGVKMWMHRKRKTKSRRV